VIILVLGMHRSGTSLASGLLAECGVHFGSEEELISPNQENPKGFWERRDVRQLNDTLLHSMQCDWSEVSGLDDRHVPEDVVEYFNSAARAVLEQLSSQADHGVYGLKEPRLCLLLDHWKPFLGDEVFCVLVHRDPAEIALSLERRNEIPVPVSHYLTEQYLGRAIQVAGRYPYAIVSFADLVRRPSQEMRKVLAAMSEAGLEPPKTDTADFESFAAAELYRSRAGIEYTPKRGPLVRWHAELQRGSLPVPDGSFSDPGREVFAFEHERRFEEYRRAARMRDYLAGEKERLLQSLDEVSDTLHFRQAKISDLEFQLLAMRGSQEQHETECFELRNETEDLRNQLHEAGQEAQALQNRVAALQRALAEQVDRSEEMRKRAHMLSEISQTGLQRLNALQSSRSWNIGGPLIALMLEPGRLGRGAGLLEDLKTIAGQFEDWSRTAGHSSFTKTLLPDPSLLPPATGAIAESPDDFSAVLNPGPGCLLGRLGGDGNQPFRIGLAVTETSETSGAGDLFTAKELAGALEEELGWDVRLLGRRDPGHDWYDTDGLDCVLALLPDFDLTQLPESGRQILKVAWIRNWTDRWAAKPWFSHYDLVLCSSEKAVSWIARNTGLPVSLLRIGTNTDCFHSEVGPAPDLASDYCFTGSFWGAPRAIQEFDPSALPYDFAVYGKGWEANHAFRPYYRGYLPYRDMPRVYASTKMLIDDANHATAPWASVNSRVFDALACGTLVVSNGVEGAGETFDGLLPTYRSAAELQERVRYYLEHEDERNTLAKRLQAMVIERHGYRKRAAELRDALKKEAGANVFVTLRMPQPGGISATADESLSAPAALAAALRARGLGVSLFSAEASSMSAFASQAVITLGGPEVPPPVPGKVNLLWLIAPVVASASSIPAGYDRVLVASQPLLEQLEKAYRGKTELLLPGFGVDAGDESLHLEPTDRLLFLGDNSGQLNPLAQKAREAGFKLAVIGGGWPDEDDEVSVLGKSVGTGRLQSLYSSAAAVLIGQRKVAVEQGFVDARLFEVLAAGGLPVVERSLALGPVLDECVVDGAVEGAGFKNRMLQAIERRRMPEQAASTAVASLLEQNHWSSKAERLSSLVCELIED
jgi:hypothetical protein